VTEISTSTPGAGAASDRRRPRLAVWGLAAGVFLADEVSKSLALAAAPDPPTAPGHGGWLSLRLVHNTGASFGVGAGHPLVITLVAALSSVVVLTVLLRTRRSGTALAWAAVLGGTAGNLADRFFRSPGLGQGAVVDWIHVSGYPPSFNLADVAIRVGAVAALIALAVTTRSGVGEQGAASARFLSKGSRSPHDAGSTGRS